VHSHHGHHHHDHATGDRRRLGVALTLIVGLLAAEVVVGVVARSLALLADAGHMLTDAAALAVALLAAAMARRPPRGRWTFGFHRVEILAAQLNGITLLVVGVAILYSAIRRLIDPPEVRGGLVLALALAGVVVNLAATAALSGASRRSLNMRGAFLHVATDLAAFIGTAVAGGLILVTGWDRFDAVASLAVAALLFWASFGLLRDSTRILLESSPDVDPAEVEAALLGDREVVGVHDLHVWTVTSGFAALSAHVLVGHGSDCHAARVRLERILGDRFGLDHTTLQVEHAPVGRLRRGRLPLLQRR
jgi:cobalt-zinc-cadmium efflux system protein